MDLASRQRTATASRALPTRRRGEALGVVVAGILGCTQINPAFDEGGSDETSAADSEVTATDTEATSDTSSAGTSAETQSSSETQDAGESGPGSSSSNGDGDGDGDGDGESCDLPGTQPLAFKIYSDAGVGDCGELSDGYFMVEGSSPAQHILAQPCALNWNGCSDGPPVELEAYPHDLSDLASGATGQCIRARFSELAGSSPSFCQYNKLVVTYADDFGEQTPLLIGSSGKGDVPAPAEDFFFEAGLNWDILPELSCTCADNDPCCDPLDPPTLYAFDIDNGPVLRPYETHELSYMGIFWEFVAYQAQLLTSCGPGLELSWLVMASS